jgi:hypothetical protein
MKYLLALALLILPLPAWGQLPTPEAAKALPRLADHPWAQITRQLADDPHTYGGHGQHDLLMSFVDPANARDWKLKAATKYAPLVLSPPPGDRNFTREYGWELPWAYSIYRDVLTPDEVYAYEACLKAWVECILGFGTWGPETRLDDSDVVHGHIPFIHGTDLALGTRYCELNPGDLFPGTAKFVAVSYGQMRDCQRKNLRAELKGVLQESSGYNPGTAQLTVVGAAACGIDNYPEVKEWLPWLAETLQWDMTPDLKERLEWGDVEGPHNLHLHALLPLMYQVCGLGGDRDGKLLHLVASLKMPDGLWWANGYRAMLCFDPRTLPAKPSYDAPTGLRQTRDHAIYRSADTLWHVFAAAPTGLDHQMSQPECRLWHKGRWILDSPRAYQPWPTNQNASLAFGLEPMPDRGLRSAELIDGGAKVVLETKGPRYAQPYWDAPPSYVDRWTQTLTLSPGKLTRADRFEGSKPTRLDRYYAHERVAVESSPALQQLWHTPPGSTPKPIDGGFSWLCGDVPLKLTSNRAGRAERVAIGTNIGSYVEPSEEGGWLIRFEHDELPAEIESVLRWDQPEPPDVEVLGVIRTVNGKRELVIPLP